MIAHEEIDSVLSKAQAAVDTLAQDVGALTDSAARAQTEPDARPGDSATDITGAGKPSAKLQQILKLRVPVVVRLAHRPIVLQEVMKLAPGTILEFERTVDSELDLLANNQLIGSGFAVKVNEHFGLRVNRVGNLRQRICSLGAP